MIRRIYFMGIKGVGMATVAIIAKDAGFIVAGSDEETEYITDKILLEKGIEIFTGFKEENPKEFYGTSPTSECLMVVTGAHQGFSNPEAEFASKMGIKTISHGEAVGLFMSGKIFKRNDLEGISISGAHGKTTISAMIATYLVKLGQDPSYTIGTSEINPIGFAGHYGEGKYFVAEADEYMAAPTDRNPKFLYQFPKYLIINNIDFDHPDFFKDIESVKSAFKQFIQNLPEDGTLIVNGDDENVLDVLKSITSIKGITGDNSRLKIITYGTGKDNVFVISNFEQQGLSTHFTVNRQETEIGTFSLSVPGYHNAKNSLSAIALLMEIGISVQNIEKVLPEYAGSKRRMEVVGKTQEGCEVIDDYAHHPEEIRKTLEALRQAFPHKKLIVVFQAHTFGRTKALEVEFVSVFAGVDELIVLPTFASARAGSLNPHPNPLPEGEGSVIASGVDELAEDRAFVEKVRALNSNVKLMENAEDVVKYLSHNSSSDTVIITMGAGDVYKVAEKLVHGS